MYSGGLELLFDGAKAIEVDLPDETVTMEGLINNIKRYHLKEKEEMFI